MVLKVVAASVRMTMPIHPTRPGRVAQQILTWKNKTSGRGGGSGSGASRPGLAGVVGTASIGSSY